MGESRGEVTQMLYTHVSKCKNGKRKINKKQNNCKRKEIGNECKEHVSNIIQYCFSFPLFPVLSHKTCFFCIFLLEKNLKLF
jgi:hypothetical protein